MYPISMNHTAHILPRHLVTGTVLGWIAACGAGGSALLPFITGTMASNLGIESLQPLCVFSSPPVKVLPDATQIFLFFFFVDFTSDNDYFGSCLELCTKETQNDICRILKNALFMMTRK